MGTAPWLPSPLLLVFSAHVVTVCWGGDAAVVAHGARANASDGRNNIVFTTLGRSSYNFDVFSLLVPPLGSSAPLSSVLGGGDLKLKVIDGQSINFNGFFPAGDPSRLLSLLPAAPPPVNDQRSLEALVYVSERNGSSNIWTSTPPRWLPQRVGGCTNSISKKYEAHSLMWAAIPQVPISTTTNRLGDDVDDDEEEQQLMGILQLDEVARKEIRSKVEKDRSSIMTLATLVAAVTFAAAFTVPGGYISSDDSGQPADRRGLPVLLQVVAFKVFIISDVVTMGSSLAAMFLCVYATWDDIETVHPHWLGIRLLMMFSFAGMSTAFASGMYTILAPETLWLATLVCAVCGSLPFVTYVWAKSRALKLLFGVISEPQGPLLIASRLGSEMAHLSRVWMAASVAVVQGRSDGRSAEWRAGLRHLHLGGERPSASSSSSFSSSSFAGPSQAPAAASGTRPASAAGDGRAPRAGGNERRGQAEDAVRRAMFVSCWTPS
ncbi:hypothetical protein Taro_046074 [Colocasia esculenta]|uniref:PGG domain-containing protein n=1 Tax=Colocasia esculenta TaxID=4460 RepID=A0A843WY54_COLES|nr:hypothetical protein [Colocasia esculenta]